MKKVFLAWLVWGVLLTTATAQQMLQLWQNGQCIFTRDIATVDSITVNYNFKVADSYECIGQMIYGCMDIANEVGLSKILDPYDRQQSGHVVEAKDAVECRNSFSSRDCFRNNIASIRNTYYGSLDGSVAEQSLSRLVASVNPALDEQVRTAITEADNAVNNIMQPFYNHIGDEQSKVASEMCEELFSALTSLQKYVRNEPTINKDSRFDPIIARFVDAVVLPSYAELRSATETLYHNVADFYANPSDEAFEAVAQGWLAAHTAFNKTEAFLFGPMDEYGLDPNMDSWPLDAEALKNVLASGNFNGLDWEGDYDEDDADIPIAQSLRGFHTLEYLVFRNGMPRTTHDTADSAADVVYDESNAANWRGYMLTVAALLRKGASSLYDYWTKGGERYNGLSYAAWFKSHRL